IRSAPASKASPAFTRTCLTSPAIGLRTSFSIFIASTITKPCPFSTLSPSPTSTAMTLPGMGTDTRWRPSSWMPDCKPPNPPHPPPPLIDELHVIPPPVHEDAVLVLGDIHVDLERAVVDDQGIIGQAGLLAVDEKLVSVHGDAVKRSADLFDLDGVAPCPQLGYERHPIAYCLLPSSSLPAFANGARGAQRSPSPRLPPVGFLCGPLFQQPQRPLLLPM